MLPMRDDWHAGPALLSMFIPGLGQLIKGEILKASLIFLGLLISFPVCFVFFLVVANGFGNPLGILTLAIPASIYAYNFYDAGNMKEKRG